MVTKTQLPSALPGDVEKALDAQLNTLKAKITALALQRAERDLDSDSGTIREPDIMGIADAFRTLTGDDIVRPPEKLMFFELFSPFTCLCAILCLAFATLGIVPMYFAVSSNAITASFLDISKVFAGAIVGSASPSIVNLAKSKRAQR